MYDADKFADWLNTAFRESSFKSFSEIADEAKLTRSSVSALASAKKQTLTGKASQPKRETVIALAKALNKDIDEVLLLAGYAPASEIKAIRNRIKVSDFDGFDNQDLDDIAEYIAFKRAKKERERLESENE